MGKKRNIQFFFHILFLPAMTWKIVKSKEHCSPTRGKTVFWNIILLKNIRKKKKT